MHSPKSWLGTDYNAQADSSTLEAVGRGAPCNILIVDDEPRMSGSVKQLLSLFGYESRVADNGQQALELLQQQPIDLMLLDLEMPGVSGFQVIQEVQSKYPGTDVIIVSGNASFDSATQVLRYGASDFVRKPYRAEELMRAVNNAIERRQQREELEWVHQQLRSSEQRHRFIVNNSPDLIYMLDAQGCFSFVNERAETLLGYAQEELLGKHYSALVYEEDYNKARYAFAERRTGERASHSVELRLKPKDRSLAPRYFESRTLTIELSAMGVYASDAEADDRKFIGTYGVARDITERKQAEEVINFQLYHDLLTKLPNRALFRDRLEHAIAQCNRSHTKLAVMYLDMDRFKVVNDSLGHPVGDQLLQAVANRLKHCLRESDTLARVGGDEFNLLLPEIGNREDAEKIAAKILQTLEQPLTLEGIEIFVSFSIGIALYPDDADNLDTLVQHADTAMYHVKGHGKNCYASYRDEMSTMHSRHLAMERDLRRALDEDQLRVYLQPQVDAKTLAVTGYEALLRWEHPVEGLVGPNEFIPLAEETGLINEMGRWMLEAVCRILQQWDLPGYRQYSIAVNVSARELLQPDFSDYVLHTLHRYGVSGERLELEITENVLMQDMEQAVTKLKRLSEQGVRIAVDDFGTGYSSLSYLQTLPLNTLKIDRSFICKIQRPGDHSSIITAIVSMAKGLNLDLVAEGVETQIQLDYLAGLDCQTIQGFKTGRPAPAEEHLRREAANCCQPVE